ncbi:glycosyltransferase [Candidatus Methylacidithermus pantelleriae]|nr:glycosyltransferase [Candidatus Methylacidithermus pantelleriae]
MRFPRILSVIGSLDPSGGGPPEACVAMAREFRSLGVDAEILTLDRPGADWGTGAGLTVYQLGPALGKYRYTGNLVSWVRAKAPNYDAVFIHGLWGYWMLGTWLGLRKRVPYFVYPHGMLDPWFRKAYPAKHLKKWVYWHLFEARILREASGVLFTCEEERRLGRESFGYNGWRDLVIPYGVPDPGPAKAGDAAAFAQKFPNLKEKKIWLFLGRIHPKKGCDLLIEAFSQVRHLDPNVWLLFVGPDEGGWRNFLERFAKDKRVGDRIVWAGPLYGEWKWRAIRASELLVLPSHQENFGRVVAEALACGVPVLITKSINIWREIESDGAGMVCDDELRSLTGSLQAWIQIPQVKRVQYAEKARRCFENRFWIRRAAEFLLGIVRGLTGNGKSNGKTLCPTVVVRT